MINTRKNRKMVTSFKKKCVLMILLIILCLVVSINVIAQDADLFPETELERLTRTNPLEAYKKDPEFAIAYTGGVILENFDIAKDYFAKNPQEMFTYTEYARSYLLTEGKFDKNLMKQYLFGCNFIDKKDFNIARKYLSSSKFGTSEERKVFVLYYSKLESQNIKDRSIAKNFFTNENGRYINEEPEGKKLFTKYLKSEGVNILAINGPVKSFDRKGLLQGKNGGVNINEFVKTEVKDKYALKVEQNGELILVSQKTDEKLKETRTKIEELGTKWNKVTKELGLDFLNVEPETVEKISDKVIVRQPVGNVPFEGYLKMDQESAKLKLKEGSIKHVGVKEAEEVEVTKDGFIGKFKELSKIQFKEPSYVNVDAGYVYEEPDGIYRSIPILEGLATSKGEVPTIERIDYGEYEGYTFFDEKKGKEIKVNSPTIYNEPADISLAGNFNIEDYNAIDTKRHIIVSPNSARGKVLSLNGVYIYPDKIYYTPIYLPNQEIPEEELSDRFVKFDSKSIVVSGKDNGIILNPSALIKNEFAATGKTNSLIDFPERGYFAKGDASENGKSEEDINNVQKIVGAKVTGIYDQQTYNKVREWQKNQKLDGKQISVDGLFGKQSLQAHLQNNEGNIAISTYNDFHKGKISAEQGKIKIENSGITRTQVGKKIYNTYETSPSDPKTTTKTTPKKKNELSQVVGLDPSKKDITLDYEIKTSDMVFPNELKDSPKLDNQVLTSYFQFDRKAIYQQTNNFIDTLVNPELIKNGVEINPKFEDMADDGKIKMLYLAGKSNEGDGVILDHDTNILIPETGEPQKPPKEKIYTKKLKTKGGQEVEVEVDVVYNQEQFQKIYESGDVDIVHVSSHSNSWRTQRLYLGPYQEITKGERYFSTLDLKNKLKGKTFHKPELISIRSCVATKRVLPGFKELQKGVETNYIVAKGKPTQDIGTTILGGVLSGKSPEEITAIANAEQQGPIFITVQ
ncbi:hypothetical protein HZC32_03375 [Candidatus Woesearchaeota archaeon]|nr:hypothetical protein [Candidatus Woesearchaeota archaeon]